MRPSNTHRILFFIAFLSLGYLHAQVRSFDQDSLQMYREDGRYAYGEEPQEEDSPSADQPKESQTAKDAPELGGWLQVFIYGIAILGLGTILFLVIRQYTSWGRKTSSEVWVQSNGVEIERIQQVNPGQQILDAEDKGEYRLALRWNFIRVLRRLDHGGSIDWQKNKTNWDYHLELNGSPLQEGFDELRQIFEYVWYGERKVEAEAYFELKKSFQEFLNKLK